MLCAPALPWPALACPALPWPGLQGEAGDKVCVCGGSKALGNWEPDAAPALTWGEEDEWTATLELVPGTHEFKVKFTSAAALVRHCACCHLAQGSTTAAAAVPLLAMPAVQQQVVTRPAVGGWSSFRGCQPPLLCSRRTPGPLTVLPLLLLLLLLLLLVCAAVCCGEG